MGLAQASCQPVRLHDPGNLLCPGRDDRGDGPPGRRHQRGLPAFRPVAAGLGDRPGLHLRQPRRHRDPGHGRERRPVRPADRALLLDRRGPGDGVPRHRDDAVLLRVTGPQRAGVPAPALQPGHPPVQRPDVRAGRGADRRREPVRPGPGHPRADRLADLAVDRRLGAVRAGLHHARRAVRRDLQRGAAVLRDHRRAGPAGDHRAARRRRLERPAGQDRSHQAGRQRLLELGRRRDRALDQPAGRLDRHRLRARLRPVVRLLDHELRRGPARPVGQGPVRGPADAADRGVPEDLHSRPDHHPRPDRAGRHPQTGRGQGSPTTTPSRR